VKSSKPPTTQGASPDASSQRPALPQSKRFARYCKNTDSSAFFDLLAGPQLLAEVENLVPTHRERLFPPMAPLSMFLAQVLSPDGSCRQAVTEATLKRLMEGRPRCSSRTSAYGQARARLPTDLIVTLTRQVGALITADAPIWWHWTDRRIRLVDGTPVILADTQENQRGLSPAKQSETGARVWAVSRGGVVLSREWRLAQRSNGTLPRQGS